MLMCFASGSSPWSVKSQIEGSVMGKQRPHYPGVSVSQRHGRNVVMPPLD
jgi:hypothetical protein